MRFSLAHELSIIGAAIVAGAAYGLLTRQALLSGISANPNDFFSLFLLIISTTAWIDFIGSLPIIGLALIGSASRSFGAVVGVVVLDHKTLPIIGIMSLSITASLEITSLVAVGFAGFRLLDFIGYKGSERKKGDIYTYLKLLGLALSISFLSALFESASILGMLPFGL
ncbi:hypothetical protein E6H31_00750 [Candidatus Bathyarchaeota archaeon]|nr:MAG: hypothetical protein E6H31_00750 [Candidatus Bathyarchaeota archaeon]